jgi:hypothetical protein
MDPCLRRNIRAQHIYIYISQRCNGEGPGLGTICSFSIRYLNFCTCNDVKIQMSAITPSMHSFFPHVGIILDREVKIPFIHF